MNLKEKMSIRYKIMNRVSEYLYRDVAERRVEVINNILRATNEHYDTNCDSFFYAGKKWPEDLGYYHMTFDLPKHLEGEMDSFLAWYKPIVEVEVPLIETFIRKILNYSDDLVYNVGLFPSALHGVLATIIDMTSIERSNKSVKEVAEILGLKEKHVNAMSFRLMANLVGA
ncbi:MAG: hypothetical protein DI616_15700 [Paracoccus denitrificans]|uniref:Uncharacterized protein n=1 Tax=Paracoccus denitrificans TaxID=266 RepID=A0A533I578_PARDE|nr:MAG: hypothetical protein DI616_15700 [Paracoccus denitrificans]